MAGRIWALVLGICIPLVTATIVRGAAAIPPDEDRASIGIDSEIMPGDEQLVAEMALGKSRVDVVLNSPGGDVDTAMAIGRMVRAHDGSAIVNGRCYSACVLIFAAGATRVDVRTVQGGDSEKSGVGIHRIYFPNLSPGLSQSQVKARYDAKLKKVRSYLREMNVAPELLSLMQSIEPENVRLLTKEELQRYGLGDRDVIYNERMTANDASELGISTTELRQRRKRVADINSGESSECNNLHIAPTQRDRVEAARLRLPIERIVIGDCASAIYYGVPLMQYRERIVDIDDRCNLSALGVDRYVDCRRIYITTGR